MDGELDRPQPRRRVLAMAGGIAASPLLTGLLRYKVDRSFDDASGDGIPDRLKRSSAFHRTLTDTYGDQFEGLAVGRRDFLLDVRYVGDIHVPVQVKRALERRFREKGIYLQWLDHPDRFDPDRFDDRYGNNSRRILWARDSLYHEEIDGDLENVAMQLIMVPGAASGAHRGRIYSPWADATGGRSAGYINGMNFGNRAVAAKRHEPWEQTRLVFHEIAHLALCHDDDPENTGVMGTNETLTLTDPEWATFRENLDRVRDTTGYDLLFRSCLWVDDPGGIADG